MNKRQINLPGLEKYVITDNGIVTLAGKPINQYLNHKGYYRVLIDGKNYLVHRLVALTFLPTIKDKDIIYHIDGNKTNNHVSNLRWCTREENNKFKFEQGLDTCSEPVITINIETGECLEHYSLTQACKYIGHSRINTSHTPLYKNTVYKGKNGNYNILYKNKETPEKEIENKPSYIFINNGKTMTFTSRKDMSLKLFGKVICRNINDYRKIVKAVYPDSEFIIDIPKSYVEVYDTKIKKTVKYNTTRDASEALSIPKSTINKFANIKKEYNGYMFRYSRDSNCDWDKYCKHEPKNKPLKILILDFEKNWFIIKDSLRSASEYFGVDKNILKSVVKKNGIYKNRYRIMELK